MAETGADEFFRVDRPPPVTSVPVGTQESTGNELLDALLDLAGETGTRGGRRAQQLLRALGLETVRPRGAAISEALAATRRLAAGSRREVLTQFSEQINAIQQQLQATSRGLARVGGRSLGGQRQRAQTQALAEAATRLQEIFAQGVLGGEARLLQLATGIRPLTALQVPGGRESVEIEPFTGFPQLGAAAGNLTQILQRVLQRPTTFTPEPFEVQPFFPTFQPGQPLGPPFVPATTAVAQPVTPPPIFPPVPA